MAYGWKTSSWTVESMINCKWLSTYAGIGQERWLPAMSKGVASLKAPLCNEKPWLLMGIATNQLEAPLSLACMYSLVTVRTCSNSCLYAWSLQHGMCMYLRVTAYTCTIEHHHKCRMEHGIACSCAKLPNTCMYSMVITCMYRTSEIYYTST